MNGDLTWIDLSTFDVELAQRFYGNLLGWEFTFDDSGYITSSSDSDKISCAGLYEMPNFFQKIKMPSFWMTYMRVDDIAAIVNKAKELGGKIELEEEGDFGKVALIRDPSGAGFTCYEGNILKSYHSDLHGNWSWSELFVSDISLVRAFYTNLFDWRIEPQIADRYMICNKGGNKIGSLQVAANEIKGDKEFWAVYFAVRDLSVAEVLVADAGGQVVSRHENADGSYLLVYDNQGAAFFLNTEKVNS